MPLKVRTSKFRHVYGQPTRKDGCFENIRITKNAHDSNFVAVNPKFIAVVLESVGGGAFLVQPLKQIGRVDVNAPKVCGHAAPITDIKWNPFDDHVIASSSDDLTIKIWEIPELGLHNNMTNFVVELRGHGRRVTYIEWHPTAENVLLSCGFDYRCIIWNVAAAQPLNVISCHSNTIYSISWNFDGSLFATTCKDKKIRVIDPRTGCVLQEGDSHTGLKASKVIFLKDHRLFTTGFSRGGDRELALWAADDLSQPLVKDTVDYSSGVLLPYYDSDIDVVYIAGKGDGNVRYYEIYQDNINFLNQYPSSDPQRGLGQMPKRGLDVSKCEIARFYKLHTNKQLIEPLPMIVPRRSDEFAEDIYPPTLAACPALTADEWASGIDRQPVKISVKPRRRKPRNTLEAIIELAERGNTSEPCRVGTLRAYTKAQQRTQVVKPVQKLQVSPPPKNAPASLQNIYKLCTDTSKVSLQSYDKSPVKSEESVMDEHEPSPPAANLLPSQIRQQQNQQHQDRSGIRQQVEPQHRQVQQANVRPHSMNQPEYNNQQHQKPQIYHQQQNHQQVRTSPQEFYHSAQISQPQANNQNVNRQQQFVGYQELQQSDQRYAPQNQTQHGMYQNEQPHKTSPQPMKWKNNLAWQKPAAPVSGNTGPSRSPSHYKVIGHSSPKHTRQPSPNERIITLQPPSYDGELSNLDSTPTNQSFSPSLSPHASKSPLSHKPNSPTFIHLRSKSCPSEDQHNLEEGNYRRQASPEVERTGRSTRSRERSSDADVPLAYRFTSSTLSPHNDTNGSDSTKVMSEVERKKKMRSMKQKIKRSSSASRVESTKPYDQGMSPSNENRLRPKTPPARLSYSRGSSEESVDLKRKQIIADKVAELKRIRDLAKAYADGEAGSTTTTTPNHQHVTSGIPTAAIQPNNAPSKLNGKPAQNRGSPQASAKQQRSGRYAMPEFIEDEPTRRQKHIEAARKMNVSRYDNATPDDLENLPKFPIPPPADSPQTTNRSERKEKRKTQQSGVGPSKVSAPIAPHVQTSHGGGDAASLSNDELHKAYFKQCEDIKVLRQMNQAKDKKIDTLEKELAQLKKMIISL